MSQLKVVLIGAGKRAENIFIPILEQLSSYCSLVGVMSRTEEKVAYFGRKYNIPWFTDLEKLVNQTKPDIAIITTSRDQHLEPFLKLADMGVSLLVETPLAETREDMELMLNVKKEKDIYVEVVEQYFRYPRMQLIKKILSEGIIGIPQLVFSVSVAHGYHGLSLLRNIVGFDRKPISVSAHEQNFEVMNHIWRKGYPLRNTENWQHGMITYDSGQSGVYHYSSLTYGSPMRQNRRDNPFLIYGMQGMIMNDSINYIDQLSTNHNVKMKRNNVVKNNLDITNAMSIGGSINLEWENPLRHLELDDDLLSIALCLKNLIEAVQGQGCLDYGMFNAYIDRRTELALEESWHNNNSSLSLDWGHWFDK
ncbi:Gfo/Idh/MocA family protein [Spirochaeta cellobiosiphila]|uniref:Gfo/Idh/MocA family protein n=1 Tax=Spirochaeta cellobiosiphila TaxID=504483 RepID=UPI000401458B|nr:Gfo/Idh/MocA family oxidoreductase [Spirochaeta cellobiosiphila]